MNGFYEKLKAADPARLKALMTVTGVILGLLCWAFLRMGVILHANYLIWIIFAVFLVIMLFAAKITKDTGINLSRFRFTMAATIGVCLVAFVVTLAITSSQAGTPMFGDESKGKGIIELIFRI